MDQVISVIGQHPFRVLKTLHAHRVLAAFLQLQADLFADGLNLLGIGPATDYEEIRERRNAPQIQNPDIDCFLGFGGADGS